MLKLIHPHPKASTSFLIMMFLNKKKPTPFQKTGLLLTLFLCIIILGHSQSGNLDPSFGNQGIVKTDMGADFTCSSMGRQVIVKPDGGMYILFNYPTFISKRFADGSIDPGYGFNGYSKCMPFNDACAALMPDGKIVVAGSGFTDFAMVRVDINGNIDSSFGNNGIKDVSFSPAAIAVQNDGKILLAGGNEGFMVARYNKDGKADSTFNATGEIITVFTIKIPADINENDSVEIGSGTPYSILLQPNGKIIVGGSAGADLSRHSAFAIARYNTNGSPDNTFNKNGRQTTRIGLQDDVGYAVALQNDGKIILAGYTDLGQIHHFAVVRYTAGGTPDKTFNGNGKQTANVGSDVLIGNSAAIQSNGKIVLAGYTLNGRYNDFAVVRFNTNGTFDKTFDKDGIASADFTSSDDYAGSVAIQSNGKIVVAGFSYTYPPVITAHLSVIRLNTDGSPDRSFGKEGKLEGNDKQGSTGFNAIAIQADGKVVAAGQTWNGRNYDFAVTRYNTDGSPDNTFGYEGKLITDFDGNNDYANSVVIQKNGKIVTAGNSNSQFALARYNADGSPAITFNVNGRLRLAMGFHDIGESVALQSDGKIVMAGYTFTNSNFDSAYFAIARLNANGFPDKTFSRDGKQLTDFGGHKNFATAVCIQTDGKIVVGGYASLNDQNNFAVARYNVDGSPDNTFSHNGKQNSVFGLDDYFGQSLAIQKDGRILVGGFSETLSGAGSSFAVARYKASGDLDNTFNTTGFQATTQPGACFSFGRSVAVSNNGEIAVGGTFESNTDSYAIAVYKSNGSPDNDFGLNGIQTTSIGAGNSAMSQLVFAGNKLYAAGNCEFQGNSGIVARYLLNYNHEDTFTISLTAPTDKAIYAAHTNVGLAITASNVISEISKVAFYNGTTWLHTSTTAPYSFKWKDVAVGNYILTAKATANDGATAWSVGIHISVVADKKPIVIITNPVNASAYTTTGGIIVSADAFSPGDKIEKVEFYTGNTLLHTEENPPYLWTWKKPWVGNYNITAKVVDTHGSMGISTPVNITVTLPGISISSRKPASGDTRSEIYESLGITLSPNPAVNVISFYTPAWPAHKQITALIRSSLGSVVKTVQMTTSAQRVVLNISSLRPGVYTLTLTNDDNTISEHFVKL